MDASCALSSARWSLERPEATRFPIGSRIARLKF
jgi:hypothetical protein